jgi:asparagine synthase (glutamine-hydrolysing)
VVRPDALQVVDRLVDHFDEPFGDSSAVPTWYVCEMARRHVTVVLSGDGGDELFGGYDRYLPHPRVAWFDSVAGSFGRNAAAAVWPVLPHGTRGKSFLRHVAQGPRGRYIESVRLFQDDEVDALLTMDARRAVQDGEPPARQRFDQYARLSWPNQMMRLDLDTYLPDDILTKVDRMSMAHSIESRVPLLDHEVVAFAASLPSELKIAGAERKRVLKRAAARILPAEVLARRKRGFGVPIGDWFRGPLRPLLVETLQSRRVRERGYFQERFVDRLVREHLSRRRDHTLRLWQLLMFELWHRRYLDASGTSDAQLKATSFPHDSAAFPESGKHIPAPTTAAAESARM